MSSQPTVSSPTTPSYAIDLPTLSARLLKYLDTNNTHAANSTCLAMIGLLGGTVEPRPSHDANMLKLGQLLAEHARPKTCREILEQAKKDLCNAGNSLLADEIHELIRQPTPKITHPKLNAHHIKAIRTAIAEIKQKCYGGSRLIEHARQVGIDVTDLETLDSKSNLDDRLIGRLEASIAQWEHETAACK